MKLAPKDSARLLALRKRAEDPGRYNLAPEETMKVLGEQRFGEIMDRVNQDGVITFTAEEARRVHEHTHAPEECHLSHGVFVMLEVWGLVGGDGAVAVMKRHASLSRSTPSGGRERLPERYVQSVLDKLGFSERGRASQNPASAVWHAIEQYEPPADDTVGTALDRTLSR